jgi:hypothetical protein
MTDADRLAGTTRMLLAAAREAAMPVTGDGRVSEADASRLLGFGDGTMRNLRLEGRAPRAYRAPINGCRISYRIEDLAAWVEARRLG